MLSSTQNKNHSSSEEFLRIANTLDITNSDVKDSDFVRFCENFLIKGEIQELRDVIAQINKINLPLHINLIYKLYNVAIALCMERKINYLKIFVLLKSILQINYIDSSIITKMLGDSLHWLELDAQVDSHVIHQFFDLIFSLVNQYNQSHHHILNNFPIIYAHNTLNRGVSSNHPNDMHKFLLDYIYSEAQNESLSNRHLNNFLKFLIKYYSALHEDIEKVDLFWYLIGRNMGTYEISNNAPIFNPIDLGQTSLFNDVEVLHEVLYKILHSQPEETPSGTIAKILFSFSGLVINSFGFQFMMDILSAWYDLEENVNFRYGFHITYISLISNHQNPEMTLNFTSHIIFKEHDPDLLIKVIFNLYDLGVGWKLIYPFVILPLIHNNDISSKKFKDKISKIYRIYFDDLLKSVNGKLLSRTEDLFLIFWMISTKRQKEQMIIPLQRWIQSDEKTNTIKGTFIKSLILRTSEPKWINNLNTVYTSLGRMSVEILDDNEFYQNSLLKIYDHGTNQQLSVSSNLHSILRNDYCMACKGKIIALEENHLCNVCKFSFCTDCCGAGQVFSADHFCLGSALSGFKHKFEQVN